VYKISAHVAQELMSFNNWFLGWPLFKMLKRGFFMPHVAAASAAAPKRGVRIALKKMNNIIYKHSAFGKYQICTSEKVTALKPRDM
jgi:phosphoglycerate dehydrogenase-like enzyme